MIILKHSYFDFFYAYTWRQILQVYPPTAVNLNIVSKQMDVDVYSDDGTTKIDVKGMKTNIQIILGRMKFKNPSKVSIPCK